MIKVGDIVKYVQHEVENGDFYPPIGTIGRVITVTDEGIEVKWPKGTTSFDDIWWCDFDDVAVIPTVKGWIMCGTFEDFAKCPNCQQKKHPLIEAISWDYCPYCGEKINFEEVNK